MVSERCKRSSRDNISFVLINGVGHTNVQVITRRRESDTSNVSAQSLELAPL